MRPIGRGAQESHTDGCETRAWWLAFLSLSCLPLLVGITSSGSSCLWEMILVPSYSKCPQEGLLLLLFIVSPQGCLLLLDHQVVVHW